MIRITLALALLATPVFADADGPDAWRVIDVAPNDTLNLRFGPGTNYPVKAQLPHNARKIDWSICVPTFSDGDFFALSEVERDKITALPRWCHVTGQSGQSGWANMRYMAEDS